jgi:hypothetical protein
MPQKGRPSPAKSAAAPCHDQMSWRMSAWGPTASLSAAQANVGFRGQTGSRRRTLETTLLTQTGSGACIATTGQVRPSGLKDGCLLARR